ALGHDVHQHDGLPIRGCTGTITTANGLLATENTWDLLDVAYADRATAPAPSLTGKSTLLLHFKRIEAEHTDFIGSANDVMTAPVTDPGGTHKVCFVAKRNPNDKLLFNLNWIDFNGSGVSRPM